MKTFTAQVESMAPYPIKTNHLIECSTLRAAAGQAVNEHRNILRERKALRKRGKTTIITIQED